MPIDEFASESAWAKPASAGGLFYQTRFKMKFITRVAIAACLALSGTAAFAQASGAMSHDTMSHDAMSHDTSSSGAMNHDDAMKHDSMSKDAMGHDSKMNHAASDTMGK